MSRLFINVSEQFFTVYMNLYIVWLITVANLLTRVDVDEDETSSQLTLCVMELLTVSLNQLGSDVQTQGKLS